MSPRDPDMLEALARAIEGHRFECEEGDELQVFPNAGDALDIAERLGRAGYVIVEANIA